MVGFIFHKFVRKFTHICEKILQVCVKLGKLCLVGLGPGMSLWTYFSAIFTYVPRGEFF
jgi:hypothetical protein